MKVNPTYTREDFRILGLPIKRQDNKKFSLFLFMVIFVGFLTILFLLLSSCNMAWASNTPQPSYKQS